MNPAALTAPLGLVLSNPLALLALALVPLIVLLHSLNLRWKEVEVSSLVFWDQVIREKQTAIRLRQILRSLMLLAQLAVAVLLAVALSQPLISRAGLSGRGNVILVLDETASMNTREGPRTRFDDAKARALDLLPVLRRGSSLCVITAARSPRLLVPFTPDRQRLRRIIQGERATDEAGDMRDSVLFALSLRDPKREDRVVILTDGAFDTLGDLDDGGPWISMIRVGASRNNAAVTALALRSAGAESGYEMFVDVRNFSPSPMSFPLTVTSGGVEIFREAVTLGAGEERGFSMPYTAPAAGADQSRIVAEIGAKDDLSLDNKSYAVLTAARATTALIVGTGNPFLQNALSALPNVSVRAAEPSAAVVPPIVQPENPGADVVVFDGIEPPPLEQGNFILIGAVPPNLPIKVTGVLMRPVVTAWNRANPLLKSIAPQSVFIEQALKLEARGSTALMLSGEYPLALSYEREGLKVLFIAFLLDGSDFALRTAFPLLMANALDWFSPGWLSLQAEQMQAGDARELADPEGAAGKTRSGPIVVARPDGAREAVSSNENPPVFRNTSEAGFYTVTAPGATDYSFAVTVGNAEESDVTPRYGFTSGSASGSGREGEAAGVSLTPLWATLAVIALALILAEWLLVVREKR
jgi:hypothetical protein